MSIASVPNQEMQLARRFVQETGAHIFLTGKAGTGKTTFLRELSDNTDKRLIITAPTGVAAINAGGVTLHSFFQLPLGPYFPGSNAHERSDGRIHRFSHQKIQIIRSLDLLVIDEISMVRADVLDAVDDILRRHRHSQQPFGGVQMLMIGDLHQLPPVARQESWQVLKDHYDSFYFFSSHALAQSQWVTIELTHIYRQSDIRFIDLLNKVRDNRLDAAAVALLNRRSRPDFTPPENENYITLTTHNARADAINQDRLRGLKRRERTFTAEISGEFPENAYPTPAVLQFKVGAQVMFLRNDNSGEQRYFNGKIGRITDISGPSITIECPGEADGILVEPVSWDNIRYQLNEEKKQIEQEIIGQFKQYPLKLAWAITIHKSQGLTFEKAVIDAAAAFTHGQVYVALSRCKSFEGLVLTTPIAHNGVQTDAAIAQFDRQVRQNPPSMKRLQQAKAEYQQRLLIECFDLQTVAKRLNHMARLLLAGARKVQVSGGIDIFQIQKTFTDDILTVSRKFKEQLRGLFVQGDLPETNTYILNRIGKASAWFEEQLAALFDGLMDKMSVETDNQDLGRQLDHALDNLKLEIAVKREGVKSCRSGFSPKHYLHRIADAQIDYVMNKAGKSAAADIDETQVEHPELLRQLKAWRAVKAVEQQMALAQVLSRQVMVRIATEMPVTRTELKKIGGVGKRTTQKYGEDLLAIISAYRSRRQNQETVSSGPRQKALTGIASDATDAGHRIGPAGPRYGRRRRKSRSR